jgi:hypothetical protein
VRPERFSLALAFISSGAAYAQNVFADWFSVHAGNRWIYEHETRDDTGEGHAHLETTAGKPRKPLSARGPFQKALWLEDKFESWKVLRTRGGG